MGSVHLPGRQNHICLCFLCICLGAWLSQSWHSLTASSSSSFPPDILLSNKGHCICSQTDLDSDLPPGSCWVGRPLQMFRKLPELGGHRAELFPLQGPFRILLSCVNSGRWARHKQDGLCRGLTCLGAVHLPGCLLGM